MTMMNINCAIESARVVTNQFLSSNGENPMGCGFAWVIVKGARGKKATALKNVGFRQRYDGPGLSMWNPSGSMTQDMDAKYAGAEACADVLRKIGYEAYADCRLD